MADIIDEERLGHIAGGLPGDKVDLIDKDGKILCTLESDDYSTTLDSHPQFANAARLRFREPGGGMSFYFSPYLAKLNCRVNRKEKLSEEESKIWEDFAIHGIGMEGK